MCLPISAVYVPGLSALATTAVHSMLPLLNVCVSVVCTSVCVSPLLQINTLESGEIDYDHLTARLEANKDRPAILNVNIGTTVKGAVDDLDRVLDILDKTGACGWLFWLFWVRWCLVGVC